MAAISSTSSTFFQPLDSWECISQGAEARLWLIPEYLEGKSCIAKERFSKKYRHPILDARLIKQRCKAEAKCIVRCRRAGIPCPAIWGVHPPVLYLECVQGTTVRAHLEQAAADTDDRRIYGLSSSCHKNGQYSSESTQFWSRSW